MWLLMQTVKFCFLKNFNYYFHYFVKFHFQLCNLL
eukprot:SAG22_NODE_2415_length_2598_cov_3.634654_1_plen_34_part_10